MTHIITSLCLRDSSCVEVCPVECIVPGQPIGDWPWYYIDPDVCIDCGACIPECPFEAIFEETAVPTQYDAKGGEYISRIGLDGRYEGKNEHGEAVILDCTRQLQSGEEVNFTSDIKPNYDYFSDGPGYDALTMDVTSQAPESSHEEEPTLSISEPEDSADPVVAEENSPEASLPVMSAEHVQGVSEPPDDGGVPEGPAAPKWEPPIFLQIGLVRGLIGQVVGTVLGMGLTSLVRLALGLEE
ncbi:MAG: ferredoxin family protein, partial [Anaerolineales bacterium]|nr:ferredoxin family protein [Anaerolineales bacterium]